ncbi:MAG: hypothetical protein U9N14_04460, partial [Pseudomonadota bacterium]|nr:hypothetical protein [Pseudomonadota bacterium]
MTKSTSILWSLPFALLVLGVGLMPLAFGGVPDAAVAFGALVFGMLWMCWALVSLMTDTLSRLPLRSLAVPL